MVTGCDDWNPDDRTRFRRHFSACFGDRSPAFHFVSGLQGLEARKDADERALEDAGIVELEHRIRELSDPEGRLHTVEKELVRLSKDLSYWLTEHRGTSRSSPCDLVASGQLVATGRRRLVDSAQADPEESTDPACGCHSR